MSANTTMTDSSVKTLIVVILGKDVTLLILATPKLRFAISLSKEIVGRKGHEGRIFLEYGNIYASRISCVSMKRI